MRRIQVLSCFTLLSCLLGVIPVIASDGFPGPAREPLGFAERVACTERVEDVYWSHRIWPRENLTPKPPRQEVMSRDQVAAKVERSFLYEAALEQIWGEPLNPRRIQAELDRIAKTTRDAELLRDLFAALDHDPYLVAECYVRPRLAERLVKERFAWDREIHRELRERAEAELLVARAAADLEGSSAEVVETRWVRREDNGLETGEQGQERSMSPGEWDEMVGRLASRFPGDPVGHLSDSPLSSPWERVTRLSLRGFSPLFEEADRFGAVAVLAADADSIQVASATWIKPGCDHWLRGIRDGLRPVTPVVGAYAVPKIASDTPCLDDTWRPTAWGPPPARSNHSGVWTGTELIVWGGADASQSLNTGGRYDPATDSWTATPAVNAPSARYNHTAVWTGTEMIVWGGYAGATPFNTGGRYDPATDTWTATSTTGAPAGRERHTAVWSGAQMIVWGGWTGSGPLSTGGRYDPATDTWTATSTSGAPLARHVHTAVWADTEMIVWGGFVGYLVNTGGRYNPTNDTWTATSTGGAPAARDYHTAVWTGTEMIVWAGYSGSAALGSGGRYNPATNSWSATATTDAPSARYVHGAVWTGDEMIVWGGYDSVAYLGSGGRYDPTTDSWTTTTGANAPPGRYVYGPVWTGTEMIVWGGYDGTTQLDTGGRYCASGLLGIDYGDAPDPTYPTLLSSNGARHLLYGELYLGPAADGEADGLPSAGADGDDTDGTDDEDGVALPASLDAGFEESLQVTASAAGLLNAWLDLNADGDWLDPGEQVLADASLTAGVNNLAILIPLGATPGETFARFRLDSAGGLGPDGQANDGEVEDYAVVIAPSAELEVTISDSPDPVPEGGRLTYFVTVTNHGLLDATGVTLTDTVPPEVALASVTPGSPTCTESGGVVTCDLGTLASGGATRVEIMVDVPLGVIGTISDSAAVTLEQSDPLLANNSDTESTTVVDDATYIFSDGFESGTTSAWSQEE